MARSTSPRAGSESSPSPRSFNYSKAARERAASRRRRRLTISRIISMTLRRGIEGLRFGFLKMFGRNLRTSISWLVHLMAYRTSPPSLSVTPIPERHVPGLTKTTYSWNWADIPVPAAEAFWHGWADGMSRRCSSDMDDLHSKLGAMYNRKYYRFGLTLGERGVVARDAMAYFVERCKEEAYPQRDPSKFDPYDDIRRS